MKLHPFSKIKLSFGLSKGCLSCEKLKSDTLPLVESVGLDFEMISDPMEIIQLDIQKKGTPFIIVIDLESGRELDRKYGFQTIQNIIDWLQALYIDHFPGESPI